jgi:hypothetical protein
MASSAAHEPSRLSAVVARISLVWTILLVGGAYAGVLGWRPGAFLMLAAVCFRIAGHLAVGISEYRRIMRRPWPKVPPLDDDW